MSAQPVSAEEVAEALGQAHGGRTPFAAVGGGTKKSLIGEGEVIEMRGLTGITEYEPSEYTFTAKAGTPVAEVVGALKAKGQYLPFDPLFVKAGATLGGTVAAGLSGPGRFRYGGIRDFLIGVQFVDGTGKLVRSGGKVVKNAAGFDLPKFLVGSLGRFGILTEVSFKVFPEQGIPSTFRVSCADHGEARDRLAKISVSPLEADAIDYDAASRALYVRFCTGVDPRLDQLWPGEVEQVESGAAEDLWEAIREMGWAGPDRALAKIVVTPRQLPVLQGRMDDLGAGDLWYSSGGSVAWLAMENNKREEVQAALAELKLTGLVVRGGAHGSPWLGCRTEAVIVGAVKDALDPEGRFPEF